MKKELESAKHINEILQLRTLFLTLPHDMQVLEAEKLTRFAKGESIYFLTKDDLSYYIANIEDMIRFFKSSGVISPSRSNIYKFIKGQRKSLYGYHLEIKKESLL